MHKILDKIDGRILFELDWNSRIPETLLAKKIRKSREVVRYRMNSLMERGIVKGYGACINPGTLGYQGYKLYLKIGGAGERRREFLEYLKEREDLFWLGVADGAWDVGITFFARDAVEFCEKKNEIFSRFGEIVIDRRACTLAEVHAFQKKFLHPGRGETILYGKPVGNEIDELERRILGILMGNARMKVVEIAKRCGCGLEAARARIRRLEESGVIARYAVKLDHTKLGMEFYKSFLYFGGLDAENEKKLMEFCRGHPNILNVVRQISPWDVELEVMVGNHAEYNGVVHQLREIFPSELRNVESAVMVEDYVFPAGEKIFGVRGHGGGL